jgi:hypothetical protein
MLKALFEGSLSPYLRSDVQMVAGTLVKLDSANAGKIVPAGAGEEIYGVIAQDVVASDTDNFKLDSVTHQARVGDKVGVYHEGGLYLTDNFSGNVTAQGTKLYSGASGKFSTAVSGNAVAVAETTGDSATGAVIRIKFLK